MRTIDREIDGESVLVGPIECEIDGKAVLVGPIECEIDGKCVLMRPVVCVTGVWAAVWEGRVCGSNRGG